MILIAEIFGFVFLQNLERLSNPTVLENGPFLKRRVNLFERSTMLDDDNHLVAPNKVLERGWSGTCGCTTRARGSLPSLLKAVQRKYNLMERGKTDVR